MRNLPVHWSEGMFLRPQHFQAADRFWTEWIATSQQWDHGYPYGVRSIELSREALANFQLQVSRCEARMRDGTLVSFDEGQAPDRVDLKEPFEQDAELTVFLAIPKLALGRRNVGTDDLPGDFRYRATDLPVQDETTGGNDDEIQFRQANVRLLLSSDDAAGFEVLPIARIKRASEREATPELDAQYFPPCLAMEAWPPLGMDIFRSIYDFIGQKIEVLSQRVTERGVNLTSQQPGDLDDLFMLMVLNQAYAVMHCMTFARGLHPYTAYQELCRVLGMLSIFHGSRRVDDDIPRYDHDDLARIFRWIKLHIEQLLGAAKKTDYEQRFFEGTERGMQVAIKPEWLHSGWEWYVGVHAQNIAERECRELLRPGKLDWKMGSSQQVDLIFKAGLPGVEQLELMQPPRGLPAREGWLYYEVKREGASWKDVLATQTLALRFKMELIGNLDRLKGQRRLEVISDDRRAILEIALFAVPSTKS